MDLEHKMNFPFAEEIGGIIFYAEDSLSSAGQVRLSRQAKDAGWSLIRGYLNTEKRKWFLDNNITEVLRLPLINELWFKNKEDVMAYRLRWE